MLTCAEGGTNTHIARDLGVSTETVYAWPDGLAACAPRAAHDAELIARIKAIHDAVLAYGELRITVELREQGYEVNHKRLAHLMRVAEIVGLHLRKKVHAVLSDLRERDFTASELGLRSVSSRIGQG
ncbi:IS3 family transposase [Nocardiopsis sp. EMB25]|uniref:IS3 family transposase n=1 Tax=Nocardiopsis sp. EMB25 TaxID=2835867 RepID=UPI002283812C|nr:IS3 family transposase [Nocardiopsis sp. EMB25]MCY9785218.1 IS3 family transposase [Nocardiopsis sp. EMB25]